MEQIENTQIEINQQPKKRPLDNLRYLLLKGRFIRRIVFSIHLSKQA